MGGNCGCAGIVDECACGDALFAMTPVGKLNKLRRAKEEKKLEREIDESLSRSVRERERESVCVCMCVCASVSVHT